MLSVKWRLSFNELSYIGKSNGYQTATNHNQSRPESSHQADWEYISMPSTDNAVAQVKFKVRYQNKD